MSAYRTQRSCRADDLAQFNSIFFFFLILESEFNPSSLRLKVAGRIERQSEAAPVGPLHKAVRLNRCSLVVGRTTPLLQRLRKICWGFFQGGGARWRSPADQASDTRDLTASAASPPPPFKVWLPPGVRVLLQRGRRLVGQTMVQTVFRLGSKRTALPSTALVLVLYMGFSKAAWPLLFSCTEQPVYWVFGVVLSKEGTESGTMVRPQGANEFK